MPCQEKRVGVACDGEGSCGEPRGWEGGHEAKDFRPSSDCFLIGSIYCCKLGCLFQDPLCICGILAEERRHK